MQPFLSASKDYNQVGYIRPVSDVNKLGISQLAKRKYIIIIIINIYIYKEIFIYLSVIYIRKYLYT